MKTSSTIIISALALFCITPLQAQESERKVQMRIIENGKVTTDTTFTVKDDVDKKDIDQVSKMLNDEDVFIFRNKPGKSFSYRYHFNDAEKFDSLMRHNEMFFKHDSAFDFISKRFMEDSAFMFRNFDDRRGMHIRRMPPFPHHRIFEDEIIFDDEFDSFNEDDVIIKRSPGKKRIIIKDSPDDVKTIRKKLDNDTEIIIIKKDSKKTKPEKHISRKRER